MIHTLDNSDSICCAGIHIAFINSIDPKQNYRSSEQRLMRKHGSEWSLLRPKYLCELEGRFTEENAYVILHETPSVYAHRLKRGDGAIFAYRWFSKGRSTAVDDEIYEKITIWMPRMPSESVSKFDVSDGMSVIVVYTKGGSAWPTLHAPAI